MKNHRTIRTSNGQALAEGAAGISVLIIISVALISLLLSVAAIAFYKLQLELVCDQTANSVLPTIAQNPPTGGSDNIITATSTSIVSQTGGFNGLGLSVDSSGNANANGSKTVNAFNSTVAPSSTDSSALLTIAQKLGNKLGLKVTSVTVGSNPLTASGITTPLQTILLTVKAKPTLPLVSAITLSDSATVVIPFSDLNGYNAVVMLQGSPQSSLGAFALFIPAFQPGGTIPTSLPHTTSPSTIVLSVLQSPNFDDACSMGVSYVVPLP